ncbi:hypothetical protein [Bdellovibrio sp. GT3]|uniref:hypothetical protein n=1 Tax=Bdellovibrio sp. GT3 TaxID=3136282 RepID=UPI0030F2636A
MKFLLHILLISLLSLVSRAEVACNTSSNDPLSVFEKLSLNACVQTAQSKECVDLYEQMREEGEDPEGKVLKCKSTEGLARNLEESWSYTSGCAIGGWNFVKGLGNTVVDSVEALGEFAEEVEIARAANQACDADPNGRATLFDQLNKSAPKLLQVPKPSAATLAKSSCGAIKASIRLLQTQKADQASLELNRKVLLQKASFTPEEKEFLDWGKRRLPGTQLSLTEAAKAKLKDLGVRLECYNPQAAAAMVCEAIAEVGTLASGAVAVAMKAARMSNIAKIAGVSLDKAARLTNAERVVAAEKSLGRALSEAESKALIDAHEVAANTGRGYGSYSATDLKNKADILKSAGFSESERATLMRQGLAGVAANSTSARNYTNSMRLQGEKLLSAGRASEAKQSFRSAADSFEAVVKDAKYTKSDRDYWMGAKINANAERYDKAAEYFIKSYSKETGNSRAEAIYEALNREKQQLRVISSQNSGSAAAQASYQTHRKLIEAVVNNSQLRLSDALKVELLKP